MNLSFKSYSWQLILPPGKLPTNLYLPFVNSCFMFLYSTILKINDNSVPYVVTREREPELLLFKPELPIEKNQYSPIFWARKIDGRWAPLNIQDQALINEVVMNIEEHGIA